MYRAGILLMMLLWCGADAHAIEQKTNQVSSYQLTIMPGLSDGGFFGWIELRHEGKVAGYIYLDDTPAKTPGQLNGSKQYIITQMPTRSLDVLLKILREERNIRIRFFDPQSAGNPPSVFLETGDGLQGETEHIAAVQNRLGR